MTSMLVLLRLLNQLHPLLAHKSQWEVQRAVASIGNMLVLSVSMVTGVSAGD